MKKKVTHKQDSPKAIIIITLGILLLCLTPFVWPVSFALFTASCPKNQFGSCPFQINFPNSMLSLRIVIAWGIVSAIVIGVGLYSRYRQAK